MTMHLQRGLTTLNTSTRKKKRKITKAKLERWALDLRKYNKQMKSLGMHGHMMTMDQYVDYVHGQFIPAQSKKVSMVTTPWHQSGVSFERTTKHIPSHTSSASFAPALKKESMQYTGERKLVGIATMHKSNMVPIFADDEDKTGKKAATEIATMRRNQIILVKKNLTFSGLGAII